VSIRSVSGKIRRMMNRSCNGYVIFAPISSRGRAVPTYLNFIGDEGEDRVVAGFGKKNYTRLSKVKKQYDPENMFHLNHNIKPS
jgi:hypothetical protein